MSSLYLKYLRKRCFFSFPFFEKRNATRTGKDVKTWLRTGGSWTPCSRTNRLQRSCLDCGVSDQEVGEELYILWVSSQVSG